VSRQFDFDGSTLKTAVGKTFHNRKTPIPRETLALTFAFADDATKQTQWRGFLRKTRLENALQDIHDVVAVLQSFLQPVALAARDATDFGFTWNAPGPWRAS
jgi:hypothetical protein